MRVFHPDKKLIRILASAIEEDKKPIRIVAQGQNTALDEATESAKAYWMMGWTWEEIDSILEDSGFSAKAIASAIKAAQKYAFECLKDGPFKPLKEGQLVKLKSGLVGKLVNKYVGHISLKMQKQAQFEEDPSVMYLPEEFGQDINIGDRVEVSEGSGTMSGVEGTVVDPSNVKTDGRGIPTNVPGAYQPVDWDKEVALQLDSGAIELMFIDRLRKIGSTEDKVEITEDKIDFETSAKLQKAYTLRESAKRIMKEAQEKIEVPGEGEYPTELKKEPDIRELAPKTRVTPKLQVPKKVTEKLPEKWLDLPEATVTIQSYADQLAMYQEMINEIKEEGKKVYAEYTEKFLAPKKELEREQQEVGQKLAVIMETQRQAMNVLETVFINRTGDLLVGFVSELSGHERLAGFVDKYNVLVKFLQDNFPEAAQKSLDMIDRWDEENKAVWQELQTEVFVSKPSEKFIKGKQAQGWWSKMTNWVSDLWDSVKQKVNVFYTDTVPKIEEMNDTLESMLADMQLEEKTAKINKALKIHIK